MRSTVFYAFAPFCELAGKRLERIRPGAIGKLRETGPDKRNQPGQELLDFSIYIRISRMICHDFVERMCQENYHPTILSFILSSECRILQRVG